MRLKAFFEGGIIKLVKIVSLSWGSEKSDTEAFSVAGQYDLVAIIRVRTNEEMADLVTNQMQAIDAIEGTQTLIAFRAHSRHDLGRMLDIHIRRECGRCGFHIAHLSRVRVRWGHHPARHLSSFSAWKTARIHLEGRHIARLHHPFEQTRL